MSRAMARRPFEVPQAGIALGVLAAVLVTGAVLIAFVTAFASPTGSDRGVWVPLGLDTNFAPASITHFPQHQVFLVRYEDGTFTAFSDIDYRHRYTDKCRLEVIGPSQFSLFGHGDVPGFENRYLREPCHHVTFLVTGQRAFGPTNSDLAPLPLKVAPDGLRVDTSNTGPRTKFLQSGR